MSPCHFPLQVHGYITGTLGLSASLLHSGLTQALRDEAVQCFRFGVTPVLVATGLAARGLNIPDITQVRRGALRGVADRAVLVLKCVCRRLW